MSNITQLLATLEHRHKIESDPTLCSLISNLYKDELDYYERKKRFDKINKLRSGNDDSSYLDDSRNIRRPFPRSSAKITRMVKAGETMYNYAQPLLASDFVLELNRTIAQGYDLLYYTAFNGKTDKSTKKMAEQIFVINAEAATEEHKQQSTMQEGNEQSSTQQQTQGVHGLGELNNQMATITQQLEQLKTTPIEDRSKVAELSLNFERQIYELQKQMEIQNIKHLHEKEINALKDKYEKLIAEKAKEIEELTITIEELEIELDEQEQALNGIQEKANKTTFLEKVFESSTKRILTGVLKDNPKLLTVGLGLTKEQVNEIFEEETDKPQITNNDSSDFEVSGGTDYSGKSEKHATGLKQLIQYLEAIEENEFNTIFTIVSAMQIQETGELDMEKANEVVRLLLNN